MNTYKDQVQAILTNFDNKTDQEIKDAVDALEAFSIDIVYKGKTYASFPVNPVEFSQKASDALGNLTESALPIIKAGIKESINQTLGENTSMTDALKKAVEVDPETGEPTYTAQFLTALFEQEEVIEGIKTSLREAVKKAEENSNDKVDQDNLSAQQKAINETVRQTLLKARQVAKATIEGNFDATNTANLNNLNNGPWGIFQKILKHEQCIKAFDELGIMDVYTALVDLSNLVEEMIAYDNGGIYFHKLETEYQEGVDWWIIRTIPEI